MKLTLEQRYNLSITCFGFGWLAGFVLSCCVRFLGRILRDWDQRMWRTSV